MAHHARALAAANSEIGSRIKVLHGKVEEVEVPEKVRRAPPPLLLRVPPLLPPPLLCACSSHRTPQ